MARFTKVTVVRRPYRVVRNLQIRQVQESLEGRLRLGKGKRWDTPETAGPPQFDSLYPTLAGIFCRHDNGTDFFTNDEWLYLPKRRQLVPQKLCNMSEIYCLFVGFSEVSQAGSKNPPRRRIAAFPLFKDSGRLSRTSGSSPSEEGL